ncbi:MAG: Rossmann-fold NAD(P)-binding domain-containing protein [Planctomycetota bacterium]|jgi:2'-hydroxyisoflavone reductase
MRLLIIGGTVFLGRHIVEAARHHDLTLFNRGQSNPELFPDIRQIHGDRDGIGDVGDYDAIIDTCGYLPRIVAQSAKLPGHYTFVSSQSVYADSSTVGADESASLIRLEDPTVEAVTPETYGGLKALCEQTLDPARSLIVRPGLIVGPHDPTDRFTYWPVRMARGGDVLVPNPPDAPIEFTDARDLAQWIVSAAERRLTGAFNVSGQTTRRELFEACRVPGAKLVWADGDWLAEHDVSWWVDLPVCVDVPGFSTRSVRNATEAGMRHRPIAETVRDTRAWAGERKLEAGLDPLREAELLRALAGA